jgi:enediyne polyketide synthase
VFVLGGGDPGLVASRLEVIAEGAGALSVAGLRELAGQLALGVVAGPVRVALTAATPAQLADRARSAARRLTAGAAGAIGTAGAAGAIGTAGDPDVYVSTGAAGRVVVVFGGLAGPGLAQSARLAASLAGLRMLDTLGVTPGAAVGYSLGEITGLAWAGCLPAAEAARLVAQCGQVLRGCGCGPAAMARVAADAETARALGTPDRLHIAAYEGAHSHVLAGSSAGIRNLIRRASAAGVTVEVLAVTNALHSPAMARCAAPMRSVFAGTRFAPPRRRLISTITGHPVMPGDDLTDLLARQLSQPVLFAQAMARAAAGADLIVIAGPDDGLADLAAGYGARPCVTIPGGPAEADPATARVAAALFAAGAISDVSPLVTPATEPEDTPASRLVPRMRDGESADPITTGRSG